MRKEHTYRIDGEGHTMTKALSTREMIVLHCMECMGFEGGRDTQCSSPLCALFPASPYGDGHAGGTRRLKTVSCVGARAGKRPNFQKVLEV